MDVFLADIAMPDQDGVLFDQADSLLAGGPIATFLPQPSQLMRATTVARQALAAASICTWPSPSNRGQLMRTVQALARGKFRHFRPNARLPRDPASSLCIKGVRP